MLDPLSLVLSRVLEEDEELAKISEGRIANIFLIFSQAENHVKEMVAERTVLHRKYSNGLFFITNKVGLPYNRGSEGTKEDDASTSDYDVEIHQKSVHVIDDAGFPPELECD